MARDYLSISGTGVPVERLFSIGSNLLPSNRMKMKANRITECVSLKSWLSFKNLLSRKNFNEAVLDKVFDVTVE